jgi:glycine hydroxymethyltransferase
MIPFDEKSPFITSGIRIGTPAITTRGMQRDDMKKIVSLIDTVINNPNDDQKLFSVKTEVKELCKFFPLYPELRDQN